jgi:hypothetical protein
MTTTASTPDYVVCVDCETPCYVFEWEEGKLRDALCQSCGNDDLDHSLIAIGRVVAFRHIPDQRPVIFAGFRRGFHVPVTKKALAGNNSSMAQVISQ